jgi:hypothetical protein
MGKSIGFVVRNILIYAAKLSSQGFFGNSIGINPDALYKFKENLSRIVGLLVTWPLLLTCNPKKTFFSTRRANGLVRNGTSGKNLTGNASVRKKIDWITQLLRSRGFCNSNYTCS